MFSCEYCESFKNTFTTEHPRTTASLVKYDIFSPAIIFVSMIMELNVELLTQSLDLILALALG